MSRTRISEVFEWDEKEYVDTEYTARVPAALGTADERLGALRRTLLAKTKIELCSILRVTATIKMTHWGVNFTDRTVMMSRYQLTTVLVSISRGQPKPLLNADFSVTEACSRKLQGTV
jgi:hypothetical protein